jgi:hypothetical protein
VIEDEAELRKAIGEPKQIVLDKQTARLNHLTRQFIERSPFVCIAQARRWLRR